MAIHPVSAWVSMRIRDKVVNLLLIYGNVCIITTMLR